MAWRVCVCACVQCAVCNVHFNNLQFMLVSRAYNIKCTLYAIKRLSHSHADIRCCEHKSAYTGNQTLNPTKMKFIEPLQCRSAHHKQTHTHTQLCDPQWNRFIQLRMLCTATAAITTVRNDESRNSFVRMQAVAVYHNGIINKIQWSVLCDFYTSSVECCWFLSVCAFK